MVCIKNYSIYNYTIILKTVLKLGEVSLLNNLYSDVI